MSVIERVDIVTLELKDALTDIVGRSPGLSVSSTYWRLAVDMGQILLVCRKQAQGQILGAMVVVLNPLKHSRIAVLVIDPREDDEKVGGIADTLIREAIRIARSHEYLKLILVDGREALLERLGFRRSGDDAYSLVL